MQHQGKESGSTHPGKTGATDFLVALSLANALLLGVWMVLLSTKLALYVAPTPHRRIDYAAAVLNVLLLGGLIYGVARGIRRFNRAWLNAGGKLAFLAVGVFPLVELRRAIALSLGNKFNLASVLALGRGPLVVLALLGAGLAWRFRNPLVRCVYRIYLGSAAATAVTLPVAVYWAVFGNETVPPAQKMVMSAIKGPAAGVRVAWVIFDEWDQRMTFDERPPGLSMTNLDELVQTALIATNAYPPAGFTRASIPALLQGRYLESVPFSKDGSLIVKARGGEALDFRACDNVVRQALAAGKRVGVAGWYHPYTRLLEPHPNLAVFSESAADSSDVWIWGFSRPGLGASMFAQLGYTFVPKWDMNKPVRQYEDLMKAGEAAITNPSLDLVFLHLSVPHYPGIYNLKNGKLEAAQTSIAGGYAANLALLDRSLGEMQVALAASGLADRTYWVFSSDHWWRYCPEAESQHRIPFIVKTPGESTGRVVGGPINTVVTRDLVTGILEGKIRGQEGTAAFLEARALSKGSAYTADHFAIPPH